MQAARRSLNIGEVGATAIDHQDLPVAGIPWLGKDSQQENVVVDHQTYG